MAGVEPIGTLQTAGFVSSDAARELASSWRRLTRAATFVALLTSPALVAFFMRQDHWPFWKALLITLADRHRVPRPRSTCSSGG